MLPEARLKPARFLASEARQESTGARGFTILLHMMKLLNIICIFIISIRINNIAFGNKIRRRVVWDNFIEELKEAGTICPRIRRSRENFIQEF